MTVYRWIVRYSKLAAEWMDAQGAKVGERWHVDETTVPWRRESSRSPLTDGSHASIQRIAGQFTFLSANSEAMRNRN